MENNNKLEKVLLLITVRQLELALEKLELDVSVYVHQN